MAASGGKSDALLMDALQNVNVEGYSAIIFRKSYKDLSQPGALIDRAKAWLYKFPEVKWSEKDHSFEWIEKYGPHKHTISVLQFGYLETDNDKYNYQGGEYNFVGFDEVTHISQSNYLYMFSRCRKLKGTDVPLKVRSASNPPDDDQGQWVYHRFVNPKTKDPSIIFVPAGMDDNPYIDKESYEKNLEKLDPVTRARLRDGVWDIVRKGNMFKRDWFEFVDTLPAHRRKIRFWDMASTDPNEKKKGKKSTDPDYTAGVLLSEYKGIYYLEDVIHVRKSSAETEKIQKNTAQSDGFRVIIREEQEPGSSGDFTISNKSRNIFKGYNYKGVKATGSKALRASAVSTASEIGNIKIYSRCRNIDDFLNEAESFPGGLHDDMVDAFAGAFNSLADTTRQSVPFLPEEDTENISYWNGTDDRIISFDSYWKG